MAQTLADRIRHSIHSRNAKPVRVDSFKEYCALIASPKRRLNPTQWNFIEDEDRIKWFCGPVGSAKTTAAVAALLSRATLMPGSMWGIFRSTFWTMTAPGGIFDKFKTCAGRLGPGIILGQRGDGPIEMDIATTDPVTGRPGLPAKVIFHGLDDLEKLGSTEFTGILVTEAQEIEGTMAAKLNERLRYKRPAPYENPESPPEGPFYLWFESNPPRRNHWLHLKFCGEADCDPIPWGKKYRPLRSENEANLPPGYYETISAGYTPEMRVRYIDGECGPDPGGLPVFRETFNMQMHVAKLKFIPGLPMIRGWDFGRRRPACTWRQVTPEGWHNNLFCILGEDEGLNRFAPKVLTFSNMMFAEASRWLDFCDPHGTQKTDTSDLSSIDMLRTFGIHPRFRSMDVEPGLDIMEKNLTTLVQRRPKKMFDKDGCSILIEAYAGGYVLAENQPGRAVKDKPVKDGYYEHVMDSDRYIDVNLEMGSTVSLDKHKKTLRRVRNRITGY